MVARSGEGNLADFLLREWRNNNNNRRGGEGNFRSIAVASAAGDLFGARMNGRMCESVCVCRACASVRTDRRRRGGVCTHTPSCTRVTSAPARWKCENHTRSLSGGPTDDSRQSNPLASSFASVSPSWLRFFRVSYFYFFSPRLPPTRSCRVRFILVYISHNFIFFFQKTT